MDFTSWRNYFKGNKSHFDWLDWGNTDRLDLSELQLIKSSLQQFQKEKTPKEKISSITPNNLVMLPMSKPSRILFGKNKFMRWFSGDLWFRTALKK